VDASVCDIPSYFVNYEKFFSIISSNILLSAFIFLSGSPIMQILMLLFVSSLSLDFIYFFYFFILSFFLPTNLLNLIFHSLICFAIHFIYYIFVSTNVSFTPHFFWLFLLFCCVLANIFLQDYLVYQTNFKFLVCSILRVLPLIT
jgi:hypothetical protein